MKNGSPHRPNQLALAAALLAMVLVLAAAFSLTAYLTPMVVGDGAEYYAMFLAWKGTLRPFMTDVSWADVDLLSKSGAISGFPPAASLQALFPALRVGVTADFNHFWFYSALAAMASGLASIAHVGLSAHAAFLVTHGLLLCLTVALACRYFGYQGVLAVLALTILSPMIWYVDKVHTEFLTFCMGLSAVMAFSARNYLLSALFLAIASTQNISFAAVAAIPFAMHFMDRERKRYSPAPIAYAVLTCCFVLLHPLYYLSRYGVVTPQLLAGGADVGGHLSSFYIWILDPDVGLLPNWPLGVALIVAALLLFRHVKASKETMRLLVFSAAYLAINLVAQSSTQNLNSGATPGVARYALWYIPLFFPLAMLVMNAAQNRPWLIVALVPACAASFLYTREFQWPEQGQTYLTPSPASLYLQRHASGLYDPPVEIFAERYGGAGEMPGLAQAMAVIGPDCRKILLFPGPGRDKVYGAQCAFSEDKVKAAIARRLGATPFPAAPTYIRLRAREARDIAPDCARYLDFSTGSGFPATALIGFSGLEPHGRWTDGKEATLTCSFASDGAEAPARIRLTTSAFVNGGHAQRVRISVNGSAPRTFEYHNDGETKEIELDIPDRQTNPVTIRFMLPDAISPKALGLNGDTRKIALSVKSVRFE